MPLSPLTLGYFVGPTEWNDMVTLLNACETALANDGARVTRGSAQSLNDDTITPVAFTAESWKTGTVTHSTVTTNTRVIIGTTGKYAVRGFAAFAADDDGIRQAFFKVNGATSYPSHVIDAPAGAVSISIGDEIALSASDYIELHVYQNSGGALNLTDCFLAVRRIPGS